MFAYCNNNPVFFRDPTGTYTESKKYDSFYTLGTEDDGGGGGIIIPGMGQTLLEALANIVDGFKRLVAEQ